MWIYWFHLVHLPVCLSICGQNRVHSVPSTVLARSISFLQILSTNFRRCVACFNNFVNSNFCWFFYFRLLDPLYDRDHPWWPWPMITSLTLTLDCVYLSPSGGYPRLLCSQPDLVNPSITQTRISLCNDSVNRIAVDALILCLINWPLSSMGKDFSYLCYLISVLCNDSKV